MQVQPNKQTKKNYTHEMGEKNKTQYNQLKMIDGQVDELFRTTKKEREKKDSEKIASHWNRTTKYFKGLIIEVFAYDVDNRLRNILIDCWKR